MLDIFNSDAFSVVSLMDAVNKIKFVPSYLGASGLFEETGVSTTSVAIEERDGTLALISPSLRGAPGETRTMPRRVLRSFAVPHFEVNDSVMAEEVQNVRAFGSENTEESVMNKVAEKLRMHVAAHEATKEYARVGAIKGVITYADASSLNLFTEFNVSQETEQAMAFHVTNSSGLRGKCAAILRLMGNNLGAASFTGAEALCSDSFFDALVSDADFKETYLNQPEATRLRDELVSSVGNVWGAVTFGGIRWINYRGTVNGTDYIEADKAHIYPLGVPGLFRGYNAPADYTETVNTNGLPLYAKQYPMPNGKGVSLDSQHNSLWICTRPSVLIKAKKGS